MAARVASVAFQGIDVLKIDVQVQITSGVVAFPMVGLPDKAVAESKERIRGALQAIGLSLPSRRITVNLAPAAVQKEGSHYDLPIALAILGVMGILPQDVLDDYYVLGELGLDGSIQPVPGVLPAAMTAFKDGKSLICPYASAREATWVDGLHVVAVPDLMTLLNFFKGHQVLDPPHATLPSFKKNTLDLQDIRGQSIPKRALEIAAAGGHNMIMSGPPGSGKSMLAERLMTILPSLTAEEALELSMIYSVAGLLSDGGLLSQRPFRSPHHSASLPALVGGGMRAKPGEVTLAHHGVLFLDELPEFARHTLEALRQPLEARKVVVARVNGHHTYPAKFQLIGAMNPCPCGYLGDPARTCIKAPRCGKFYLDRLSGPLLDRVDLHVEVGAVSFGDNTGVLGESSAAVLDRVVAARMLQSKRLDALGGVTNSDIPAAMVEEVSNLSKDARGLLEKAADRWRLSLRSCHRILRVARTIADLARDNAVGTPHMQEALSYRRPE